jgi:GT2 family glycosyltransferase
MSQIKIAVAIPTYKRREMLERLIGTIPTGWSIFVSDNNGSMLPMAQPLDTRVHLSHAFRLFDVFANWNRAISLVDEDCTHVFIPSDDDLLVPEAGIIVENTLALHGDADLLIFGCDFIDGEDRKFGGYLPDVLEVFEPGDGFLKFVHSVDARLPGVLFRLDFLKRIGAFDESMQITAADSDLVQRALLQGRSVFVPQVIGLYRYWSGSGTHAYHGTDQWMNDVARWTDKIVKLVNAGHRPKRAFIDIKRYRAEVLTQNLLAGIDNLVSKGEIQQARNFLQRHPISGNATPWTRIRLLRRRFRLLLTRN